jgi:hypothetical protein
MTVARAYTYRASDTLRGVFFVCAHHPKRGSTMSSTDLAHDPYRLYLSEDQIPTAWYTLRADMADKPEPMRLPNGQVATVDDISPVFARALAEQELDDDTAYFETPEPSRRCIASIARAPCVAPITSSALSTRR